MANLHKKGLKMREWRFKELLAPTRVGPCPSLHYPLPPPPPPPQEFALLAINGPFPAAAWAKI